MLELDAVAARGARVALRAAGKLVRYDELASLVHDRIHYLKQAGVTAEDRVVLGCRSNVGTVVNALALMQQRCAVLPVSAELPDHSLENVEKAFAPRWRIADDEVRGTGAAASLGTNFAQALLSSGSAGRPKIVLRAAAHVAAGVRIFAGGLAIGDGDRVLALVPLEHSFGFNSVMLGALTQGAQIVFPESRHPRGIIDEIETHAVTVFPAPPLFFDWMHRFAERPRPLTPVRVCVSVGDILTRAGHAAFVDKFGVELWQSYGASECGPALLNRSADYVDETMALGDTYPGVEVSLRTDEGTTPGEGETGEIVVRSPAVALGYLGEQDGGSRIVDREFFTGDLACYRRGLLEFAGRRKLLIARAGRKVDPAEIEQVLRSHPDVVDAAVRAIPGIGQQPLQALVVARRAIRPEDLIDLCSRSLAAHMVPRIIEFREALPRDGAGKLQRDALGDP